MGDILIDNTFTDNGWYTKDNMIDYDILIDNTLTDNMYIKYTNWQYDRLLYICR